MGLLEYCRRCLIPSTRPDLTLNEEGVCDACVSYGLRESIDWDDRKRQLLEIVEELSARERTGYDCIIPVSGGKDSTFQVYYATKVLGLKPLCVNFTPCLVSEVGKENLANLQEMGADLVQVRVNPVVHRKLAKIGLTQVGDICWPEHVGIFTTVAHIAVKYRIPLILWGENPQVEYGGPLSSKDNYVLDRRWMEEFGGLLGLRVEDMVGVDGLTESDVAPFTYPSEEELARVGVTGIFLGSFIPWDFRESARIANSEGFKVNPDGLCEGTYVDFYSLDCVYHSIHDYFKFLKFGFGRATDHACQDIRTGRLDRDEALELVRSYDGKIPWRSVRAFLQDVGMTVDEFFRIADAFTNKAIFRTDEDGNLLHDQDGNLHKSNYDNVVADPLDQPYLVSHPRRAGGSGVSTRARTQVVVVDYGMGNLASVAKALEALGCTLRVTGDPQDLAACERIVLPGVGAFIEGMHNLRARGLVEAIQEEVLGKGKPLLGICLGMQLLARTSEEGGLSEGLGWIPAQVVRLSPSDPVLRVPNIGWSQVDSVGNGGVLLSGLDRPSFYFVHSYHLVCDGQDMVTGTFQYGGTVAATVERGNIVATQFHPEKSQSHGLQVLRNFMGL